MQTLQASENVILVNDSFVIHERSSVTLNIITTTARPVSHCDIRNLKQSVMNGSFKNEISDCTLVNDNKVWIVQNNHKFNLLGTKEKSWCHILRRQRQLRFKSESI